MTEKTDGIISAPWDENTVGLLNRFQHLSFVHPFTCGNDQHRGKNPVLVAHADGWRCPDPLDEGCEYTQNWAHATMANPDKWPHGPTHGFLQRLNVSVSRDAAEAIVDARVAAERLMAVLSGETLGKITAELVDAPAKAAGPNLADWDSPEDAMYDWRWCCAGNAEECVLCVDTNPPYPFICPGDHPYTPRTRRDVLVAATDEGREALKAAMKRLRIYAELNKGIEDDVEDEEPNDALKRAAERAKTVISHPEPSAIQLWADEDDLAQALGSFGDGYRHAQRDARVALGLDRIAAREGSEEHTYLSTGCLHGDHGYCQGVTGASGAKKPAECKFCGAKCVCGCHRGETADVLLSCGLCRTENGESFHCHPECHHNLPSIDPGTIYRHFKGDLYEVLGTAIHTEKDERLVVYRSHDPEGEPGTWVRPLYMFHDDVLVDGERKPRFELVGALEELDLSAMRKLASERLLAIALERTEREWICCDPINVRHSLCVQGEAVRTMLKALLTDDETVFPPSSDVLDEVMRLVQGVGDYRMQRSVLSQAEVTSLYAKAVEAGYEDANAGVGYDTLQKIVNRIMNARDRELARSRQRLALADQARATFIRDHEAHDKSVEEAVAAARREERLNTLDEMAAILKAENQTPYDTIALSGPMSRLRKLRMQAERGLDATPKD